MDINNLAQNINQNMNVSKATINNETTTSKIDAAMKMFNNGEVVKGEVIDVKNAVATIITNMGEVSGKLTDPLQLNIGDVRNFLIKQDDSGKTFFSIIPEKNETLVDNSLSKTLKKYRLLSQKKKIWKWQKG